MGKEYQQCSGKETQSFKIWKFDEPHLRNAN